MERTTAHGSAGKKKKRSFFRMLAHLLGWIFYRVGQQTEYFILKIFRAIAGGVRWLVSGARWLVLLFLSVLKPFFTAVWEDLSAPWRMLRIGLRNARAIAQQERESGSSAVGTGFVYFVRGVLRNRHLVLGGLAYLLPLGALAVLVVAVHVMLGSTFALRVEFQGEFVGFIADESIYDAAHADILNRIQGAGTGEDWMERPEYTLTMVDSAALYSASELTDRIIQTSASDFCKATGVYINAELIGITDDSLELSRALEALRTPLLEEHKDDESWRVEFQQHVELQNGLYFTNTLISLDELLARLHGEAPVTLSDGSEIVGWDMLDVQAVQNVTRTVEIYAEDQVINDPTLEWGLDVVDQVAQPGLEELYEDVVYVDGQEVRRVQTRDPVVLVQAVPKVTRHGTYNPYGGQEGDPATGEFAWPVPHYKSISRWAGYGHRGADITAVYGTTIVAADNGVVEIARDVRGTALWTYGIMVKIDHGNGFTTVYAHCSELLVEEGAYVVKGQPIARVGSTGYSTGPHCHFEIQVDGQWTDTRQYVMPGD